jgi:carbohydrate binding protein with CBM4/9 domain
MGTLVKRLCLSALLLVFGLATVSFGQTEILVNGGFESWDNLTTPTGWTKVENIDKDSTGVHGGTYAAKHTGGTKDLGQYLTVTPGNSYTITLWCKVEAGDNSDARLWAYWRGAGANVGAAIESPYFGATDHSAWSTWTTTLEAPAGTDTLYFEIRTYSGATAYWDDLSVVETAPPAEDPADYFIPKGAHGQGYVSLKAAVDSINIHGVSGEINLVLDADTLREDSFTFNVPGLDADSNITVKPAEGRDVVLIVAPGASEGNGPQMIGFETGYVTFDGSNDGSDSRNLIVTSEGDADVPFGFNGPDADFVTIKNLIIKNLDNGVVSFRYGVVTNDVGGQEDLLIENCQIASPEFPVRRYGVAVWGDWTYTMADVTVKDCEINAGAGGIESYKAGFCNYSNNVVNLYPSATPHNYCYGIRLSWVHSTEIKNNVFNLAEEKTVIADSQVRGIKHYSHPAGAVFTIENNTFNLAAADETAPVSGIEYGSSNNAQTSKIYHNTFILNDNASTSACNVINKSTTGAAVIDLKNNIIINKHTGNVASSAISLAANAVLTSDGNILVSDQNCAILDGTTYADLAAWKVAGQDANSDSLDVTFVSATDMHLATPSDSDLDLVMPTVGVMEDIDGDARGTFYAYAGADEGTAYPASNDLDLTFDDATDVANWSHHDETNGWTAEAFDDSTLRLTDAGYSMIAKRAVKATPGSLYKLSIDIMSSGWDGPVDPLILSVQGLGNDDIIEEIVSEGAWTTFSLIGIADATDGYIRIYGNNVFANDTVWVDNVVWDDQYMDIVPSATIADAQIVPDGDDLACIGVVTATTIGSPQFMQDADAGISLFDSGLLGKLEEGDEVLVVREHATYNGLIEVKYPIEYQVLSKGNVVEPMLVTVPELADYHGMLVMVEDVDTVAGFSWPAYSSTQTLTDGTNEFPMRIDSDGEMVDSDPPASWPLDLIGVVGWYNGPQVMPRYMADFITNQAPLDFMILNPADSAIITSFDDPEIEKIDMDGDSVYALFTNWEAAFDKEGDSLTYEMIFIGDGPDEAIVTADTFLYIPLDQEKPYQMNGSYTYYYTATDPMGEMSNSDTNTITFDFPAPPMMVDAQVVLVDGTPTYYVQFDLPLSGATVDNFKVIDTDAGTETTPTALSLINTSALMLTVPLVEDHNTNLATSGLMAEGQTVTAADTSWGHRVYIPFSANHLEDEAGLLEGFEDSTLTLFDKAPTYSGSTTGITSASVLEITDEEAYQGTQSGKFTIVDDPAKTGGWFVREYIKYPYEKTVKSSSTLFLMVKGVGNIDMAMTVKDDQGSSAGYLRTLWKHVTLCATDWQVISFDLANDPVEKWITGDGILEGGTVTLCDLHIMSSDDEDAVIYIDGFTERKALSPVNVTLNVIMKQRVEESLFNLATDYVDVAGTMNDWSGTTMTDFDGDTTYSVSIPMMPYSTQNFKFRINGSWNDATAEFPYGGPARELLIPATGGSFTYWYNDDTLEVAIDGIPKEFALHQNYPNPFNPTTTINFDLPNIADVKLVIYDITGRKVRTLVNETNIDAGYKRIVWNGRDDFGNGVSTGMYIYRLIAGDFVDVKKMTFLK